MKNVELQYFWDSEFSAYDQGNRKISKLLIMQGLQKLFDMDLYVKLCTGDQEIGNRGTFNNIKVTMDHPSIDDCK